MFNSLTARLTVAGVLALLAIGVGQAVRSRRSTGPATPGWRKEDPEELDKLLTIGVRDSMGASDPVSVVQPDVHRRNRTSLARTLS